MIIDCVICFGFCNFFVFLWYASALWRLRFVVDVLYGKHKRRAPVIRETTGNGNP